MSAGVVLINGEAHSPETASVSVFDRGFLYGDSVFEALRTYGGEPFELSAHLARLENSAALAKISMPLTLADFEAEVRRGLALTRFDESYVRILLTRGRGRELGLSMSEAQAPLRVVLILPLRAPSATTYERGIAAIIYRTQRVGDGTLASGAKLGNYLLSVLALDAARAAGAEEALLADHQGSVLEGTTSNVFCLFDGTLVTPPVSVGILAGITRKEVIQVARQIGQPIVERPLLAEELGLAQEVFVSSSIRELVPVVRVDGREIGDGLPGPCYRRLREVFGRHAHELAAVSAARAATK